MWWVYLFVNKMDIKGRQKSISLTHRSNMYLTDLVQSVSICTVVLDMKCNNKNEVIVQTITFDLGGIQSHNQVME